MTNRTEEKYTAITSRKIKKVSGNRILSISMDVIIYTLLGLLGLLMLIPLWHTVMYSISDFSVHSKLGLFLYPKGFDFTTYGLLIYKSGYVLRTFANSILVTGASVILGVLFSSMCAYAISKPIQGKNFFTLILFFTMLFSGGMIPTWLLVKNLGLLDTYWSLILPNLISAWYILIIRNFMQQIPSSVEESAYMDGANNITIFFRIIFPLSKPVIATISLFMAVWFWNDYFSTVIYIQDKRLWTLAAMLKEVIDQSDPSKLFGGDAGSIDYSRITTMKMRAATIVFTTVPILMVYPFAQKYFQRGIMMGSIKG